VPLAARFRQFERNAAQALCLRNEHRREHRLDELNYHKSKSDALMFQETTR
jgi:hypothetical protein